MKRPLLIALLGAFFLTIITFAQTRPLTFNGEVAFGRGNVVGEGNLSLADDGFSATLDALFTLPNANLSLDYAFSGVLGVRHIADAQDRPLVLGRDNDTPTFLTYTDDEGLPVLGVLPYEALIATASPQSPIANPEALELAVSLTFAPSNIDVLGLTDGVYALYVLGEARVGDSTPFDWYANIVFGASDDGLTPTPNESQRAFFVQGVTVRVHDGQASLSDGALGDYRLEGGAWWTQDDTEARAEITLPKIDTPETAFIPTGAMAYGQRGVVGYTRHPQTYFNTANYPFDAPDTLNSQTLRVHLPFLSADTLFAPTNALIDLSLTYWDEATPLFTLPKDVLYPASVADVRVYNAQNTLIKRVLVGGQALNDDAHLNLSAFAVGDKLTVRGYVLGEEIYAYSAQIEVIDGEHAQVLSNTARGFTLYDGTGLAVYSLPNPSVYPVYTPSTILLSPRGRLIVSNPLLDSVSLITPSTATLDAEYSTGETPYFVALSDGVIVTANRGDNTLSLVDVALPNPEVETRPAPFLPMGMTLRDATSLLLWGQQVAFAPVSLENETTLAPRFAVDAPVNALAVWGDVAYLLSDRGLSLVYLPTSAQITEQAYLPSGGQYHALAIDANRARLYVVASVVLLNAPLDIRYQPYLLVIDLKTLGLLDAMPLDTLSRAGHLPSAIALNPQRTHLYIVFSASESVMVFNLQTRSADDFFASDANPIGIAFNRDGTRVFVHNGASHTLTVRDTRFFGLVDTIPTTSQTLPADVQKGATLFYSAEDSRLAWNNSISCATCHQNTPNPTLLASALNDHIRTQQGGDGLDAIDTQALIAFMQSHFSP